jgi:hypothetical protein
MLWDWPETVEQGTLFPAKSGVMQRGHGGNDWTGMVVVGE